MRGAELIPPRRRMEKACLGSSHQMYLFFSENCRSKEERLEASYMCPNRKLHEVPSSSIKSVKRRESIKGAQSSKDFNGAQVEGYDRKPNLGNFMKGFKLESIKGAQVEGSKTCPTRSLRDAQTHIPNSRYELVHQLDASSWRTNLMLQSWAPLMASSWCLPLMHRKLADSKHQRCFELRYELVHQLMLRVEAPLRCPARAS